MNAADSERVRVKLSGFGARETGALEEADIAVVNTCAVRQHAEERALSYVGRLKKWKEKKPGRRIGVLGCVPERLGPELKRRFPYVDFIVGAKSIARFDAVIARELELTKDFPETPPNLSGRALVPIIMGCDNACSYCIVPTVRGTEVSRDVEDILAEISGLLSSGTDDIMLLGQNVNSYNGWYKRMSRTIQFPGLLAIIAAMDKIKKLSFMTSHPKDMRRELIDFIAKTPVIDRTIHLPMQSGSNRILKMMNRGYTREDYLNIVHYIEEKHPELTVSTDFIVGFPTEADRDFEDTLDVLSRIRFSRFFAFKYSPREGTSAFALNDDVPREVKESRHARLLALAVKR